MALHGTRAANAGALDRLRRTALAARLGMRTMNAIATSRTTVPPTVPPTAPPNASPNTLPALRFAARLAERSVERSVAARLAPAVIVARNAIFAAALAATLGAPTAAAQDAQRGRDIYLDAAAVKAVPGLPSCVQCHGLPPDDKLIGASVAQLQGAFASVIAMGRFALELDARDLADLSAFLRAPAIVPSPLPAVAPLSPAFAALPGTRSPTLALRLSNEGRATLTLAARDAVVLAGAGASQFVLDRGACVDGASLAPGAHCEVALQYAPPPGTTQPPEAQLQWRYAGLAQPTVVALAAQPRSAAAISLSVTGLSFGATDLGGTVRRSLRIDNGGQEVLALDAQALTGAAAADFAVTGCAVGLRLAPGAGCDLQLAFTPASAGPRQAQLAIGAADSAGAQRLVALVGEGRTAASPSPSPSPSPAPAPAAPPPAVASPAPANSGGGGATMWAALLLMLPALWRRRRS